MKLTSAQREQVRMKFGGKCAYCGCDLPQRWHADHLKAVERKLIIKDRRAVSSSEMWRPHNDTLENMMPSCPPCNIDKHSMSLDSWRRKLEQTLRVLFDSYPTYRHAIRFGLVAESPKQIKFYFEVLEAA
jgi:5-methylcytosine-specific restriction endonuclease McrA